MTKGRLVFQIINYTVLIFLSLLCLFPLLNILAMSFSSATAVSAGRVSVWPVEFNTYAYSYVIGKRDFWNSLLKSVERVCIGVPFSMLITILVAYPLSKERTQLRLRSFYSWIFFFTMLFSGADSRISADSESASDGYHLGADSPYGCSCLQHCTYAEFFSGNTP